MRLLLRVAILTLTLVAAVAAVFVWRAGGPVNTVRTPEVAPAPVAVRVDEAVRQPDGPAEKVRVGNFGRPEEVPEYEILEERTVREEETRAAQLLVDTEARSEADYGLIARDLKSRYARYDAVTAEFTDTEVTLDYQGTALIFNTMQGASYMGFFYGPPNDRGYYVRAAG